MNFYSKRVTAGAFLVGALLFIFSPASAVPQFDAVRAFKDLQKQCALGPRVPGTSAHAAQLTWMEGELKKLKGAVVTKTSFTHRDTKRSVTLSLTNLSVSFKGKGAGKALFGAHWDSRPWADKDPNPLLRSSPVPGANDGASGVAVLLEMARALSITAPPFTVVLAFFDGEDYGQNDDQWCLGSKQFASGLKKGSYDYMILLDMIGDKDLRILREQNSWKNAHQLTARVFALARTLGLSAFRDEDGFAIYDDHIPFLEKGIPALDLIDFDYPYWHTVSDLPERCSAESLKQVGTLMLHLVYQP